jgi:peptidoglycan/xylan/chitin deacetylase (PgdA/CDA1 family)
LQKLYPGFEWTVPTSENKIFLTFDDGPHPEITPWVLAQLKEFNAKATFFCVGENVTAHPQVLGQIAESGHTLGNHTDNHLKGWNTKTLDYVQNTLRASEKIPGNLFRPPYGRITRNQGALLKARGYRIIMWSLLSCDYLQSLDRQRSLDTLVENSKPGSIVVFHDSAKARDNMQWLLPRYLEAMVQRSFQFSSL